MGTPTGVRGSCGPVLGGQLPYREKQERTQGRKAAMARVVAVRFCSGDCGPDCHQHDCWRGLLTKATGVKGGGGWAAVIFALPLLAGVVGALLLLGFYAATLAVSDFGDFGLDIDVHRHPAVLGRARGIALGALPVYLAAVVVGLAVGGFL